MQSRTICLQIHVSVHVWECFRTVFPKKKAQYVYICLVQEIQCFIVQNRHFFSRKEEQLNGLGAHVEAARVFQASTEYESSEDAFRWRKYGQKAVNGNLFPRSYYRCSTARCNARKFVERSSDNSLVTTYEGRHNHIAERLGWKEKQCCCDSRKKNTISIVCLWWC